MRIDALKDGSGITVLHREMGLEQKIVDGQLTAVQHLEGLMVGDLLRVTVSISQRDEVLRGNVQDGMLLLPQPIQVGFGRARLVCPQGRQIAWKAFAPGVSAPPRSLPSRAQVFRPLRHAQPYRRRWRGRGRLKSFAEMAAQQWTGSALIGKPHAASIR